jgi:hypothetical protein
VIPLAIKDKPGRRLIVEEVSQTPTLEVKEEVAIRGGQHGHPAFAVRSIPWAARRARVYHLPVSGGTGKRLVFRGGVAEGFLWMRMRLVSGIVRWCLPHCRIGQQVGKQENPYASRS